MESAAPAYRPRRARPQRCLTAEEYSIMIPDDDNANEISYGLLSFSYSETLGRGRSPAVSDAFAQWRSARVSAVFGVEARVVERAL